MFSTTARDLSESKLNPFLHLSNDIQTKNPCDLIKVMLKNVHLKY